MKLLRCTECLDVFNLTMQEKACSCGKTKGKYIDNLYAQYSGPCAPIGFDNNTFYNAIRNQSQEGSGVEFLAFIIPKECPTMERLSSEFDKTDDELYQQLLSMAKTRK